MDEGDRSTLHLIEVVYIMPDDALELRQEVKTAKSRQILPK